jgi:hypothetical protein
MWYPKFVLTREDKIGLSIVDGCKENATSWKGPYAIAMIVE